MKKFIIIISCVVALLTFWDIAHYRLGWYVDLRPDEAPTAFVRTQGDKIYMDTGSGFQEFEIRGVNLGSGIPGDWATDFAVDKETYLRWFRYIQEMGANTIRIYTIQQDVFYNALYEYNSGNPDPLWVIHGVWVNDYVLNSHRDAYDQDFYDAFLKDCHTMVDVIHGNKKIHMGRVASAGSGTYNRDVSPWVIGYILGVEWEDVTVRFTDEKYRNDERYTSYSGDYLYTTQDASPFEALLARVGDSVIQYESKRYKVHKLMAFSNWPTTDPFEYPETIANFFMKCAYVDVEHIGTTEAFLSGQFASYHVYPYYPDYLTYVNDWSYYGFTPEYLAQFMEDGVLNTYRLYLSMLTGHHTMPVVITEFGVSTGRGIAQLDRNTGRNQGHMSEREQGEALVECYEDIMASGAAGCCVFSWQDEWFKRTWNTMHAVNLMRTPYWSDYQTNEQYFGLLSFDPGEEECVCYVDGDVSEWTREDILLTREGMELSVKYDERFLYLMVRRDGLDPERDTLYIPVDTTLNSGSSYCENNGLLFDRAADFLLVLDGTQTSRLLVQERYEALRSTYAQNVYQFDTYLEENVPEVDSPRFVEIDMILQAQQLDREGNYSVKAEVFPTGRLRHGNANPNSPQFDSLADFMYGGGCVEVKLPWQLLNFSDPSRMEIHDDYYNGHYGIQAISIDEMYLGLASGRAAGRVHLEALELEGWNNKVTCHERLKPSYYALQELWANH